MESRGGQTGRFRVQARGQDPSGLVNSASSPLRGAPFSRAKPAQKPPLTGEVGKRSDARTGSARLRVLRHLPEVVYQNTLDIIIPPRVAVLDADQLKAVLAADLVLLVVTALDGGVVVVLAAIQLDG